MSAVVSAAFAAAPASAEDWIAISGYAQHMDGRDHCNAVTTGLGLERDGWAAGFYRNSNCRWSVYGGKTWLPLRMGPVSVGGIAGFVTGYRTSPMPAAAFAGALEGKRWGLNVVYVPPYGDSGNVLWFQIKRRWQ